MDHIVKHASQFQSQEFLKLLDDALDVFADAPTAAPAQSSQSPAPTVKPADPAAQPKGGLNFNKIMSTPSGMGAGQPIAPKSNPTAKPTPASQPKGGLDFTKIMSTPSSMGAGQAINPAPTPAAQKQMRWQATPKRTNPLATPSSMGAGQAFYNNK